MIACAIGGSAPLLVVVPGFVQPARLHPGSQSCRGVIGPEHAVFCQQRPYDPGILVRQRDRRHVLVPPAHQFSHPTLWFHFVLGKADHRSRPVDHQGAQVKEVKAVD